MSSVHITNSRAVIILSGGIDSTTLLYYIKEQGYAVTALTFDYRQRHRKEIDCATKIATRIGVEHKILDLTTLNKVTVSTLTRHELEVPEGRYDENSMKVTVVPYRNLVMLSIAAAFAASKRVPDLFYGAHSGDHPIYPDCRPEFIDALNRTLAVGEWNPVRLRAPFSHMNKGEIIQLGLKIGVPYELTWTCYKGLEKPCGKCGSCIERLEAFKYANAKDPLDYEKYTTNAT